MKGSARRSGAAATAVASRRATGTRGGPWRRQLLEARGGSAQLAGCRARGWHAWLGDGRFWPGRRASRPASR